MKEERNPISQKKKQKRKDKFSSFFISLNDGKNQKGYLLNAREAKLKAIVDPTENFVSADKVSAIHYPYTRRHFFSTSNEPQQQEPQWEKNQQGPFWIKGSRFWGRNLRVGFHV